MFTKCESGNVLQTRTSPAAPLPPPALCSLLPAAASLHQLPAARRLSYSQCSVLRFIIGFEYNGIVMKCAANDGVGVGDGDGDSEV